MKKSIAFIHPDLGIGGAERLVVDCALAVLRSGYDVKILTNHHDPNHCFEETNCDLNVKVVGSWIPRSIYGRCIAMCAYIRFLIASFYAVFTFDKKNTILFVDQISAPLILFYWTGFKTCFYCHFPDQLLTDRKSILKRIYRYSIDFIEEYSMRFADKILVNSNFTAGVVKQTFPSLRKVDPEVLYPVPNTISLSLPAYVLDPNDSHYHSGDQQLCRLALPTGTIPSSSRFVFVSINRYERKKNLNLALHALNHLITHWEDLVHAHQHLEPVDVHLVIAGGYDLRISENVEYHQELEDFARELNLTRQVTFLRSCSAEVKSLLIAASDAVLYTPEGEHFGIVPTEAMFLSRPVIALDSGGPRETVLHGSTGFLSPVTGVATLPAHFANSMARLINDPTLVKRMGKAARQRVENEFSFDAFKHHLTGIVKQLI